MTGIRLRLLEPGDLDGILEIEAACFSDAWPESAFRSELGSACPPWVAVDGGRIVGYLCCLAGPGEMHITNLAVAPDRRREGIGRRLVNRCIRAAAAAGCDHLYLDVRPSNTAARGLYEHLGFREIFRRRGYYIKPSEDGLVLARPLGPADRDVT